MPDGFRARTTVEELWSNLVNGVESIRRFSADELIAMGVEPDTIAAPGYVPAAGVLANVKAFDAAFFGYSPREAELMDPQHRIFLECAWEALEDAAIVPESHRAARSASSPAAVRPATSFSTWSRTPSS